MSTAALKRMSVEEYLAREELADERSEYYDGEVFAMAGGTANHSLIALNLGSELRAALQGSGCRALNSDMQVKTPTDLYTYPDLSVVCGQMQFQSDNQRVLLNPRVLFEVLSPSTEHYDRGIKFEHYRSVPSLQEFVLISQERPVVEHYARQSNSDQWLLTAVVSLDSVLRLPCLGCQIPLREIYADVEFGPTTLRPRDATRGDSALEQ